MPHPIKIGICVAYDWYYLERALPYIYDSADKIVLSLDKDHISWSLNPFEFDDVAFSQLVSRLDLNKKITIVRDDYHLATLSPMENEVRQRNEMAKHLGAGGWHLQLDCDEYFLEFPAFATWLKNWMPANPVNVCCSFLTLFKQLDSGYLVINPESTKNLEFIQIATNKPEYKTGRRNDWFNVYTNFILVHQSWARNESEVVTKITNWGHRNDFDSRKFVTFWKELSEVNYQQCHNLHPIIPQVWPSLKLVRTEELYLANEWFPRLSVIQRWWLNSIWFSRVRAVYKKFVTR